MTNKNMALAAVHHIPPNFLQEILELRTKIPEPDLQEHPVLFVHLSELFTCTNDKELLQVPKKIIGLLKAQHDIQSEHIQIAVDVMVAIYIRYPTRHPLKNVFKSLFQSFPPASQSCIATQIEQEISHLISNFWNMSHHQHDHLRALIEAILNLLENFTLGEESLRKQCMPVIKFLSQCLQEFLTVLSLTNIPPVQCNEIMHHCLSTSKAVNKVLQKFSAAYTNAISSNTDEMDTISAQLASTALILIQEEKMLIECRTNGAMTLVLLLQLWDHNNSGLLLSSLLDHKHTPCQLSTFPHWFQNAELSNPTLSELSASSSLSVIFAMLAVIPLEKLTQPYLKENNHLPEDCTIFNIVLRQLFVNISRSENVGTKLLGCRSLILWTSKMGIALKEGRIEQIHIVSLLAKHGMFSRIMDFIWTAWEDHSDAIRLTARNIFQNMVIIYQHATIAHEPGSNMEFVSELTVRLLQDISWSSKGKYGALCCLVNQFGSKAILQLEPNITDSILQQMKEHQLASYASELYEKLLQKHQQELWVNKCKECGSTMKSVKDGKNTSGELCCSQRQAWCHQWIQPVVHLLCTESIESKLNIHITEYLLPKLLKSSRHVLEFMVQAIWPTRQHVQDNTFKQFTNLGALLTCLRRAKSIGVLYQLPKSTDVRDNENWNGVVPFSVLNIALNHLNNQIRLDAYALLCENIKMTEPLTQKELSLLFSFIRHNINNQIPAFRQELISHSKKLFVRMKESSRVLKKEQIKANDSKTYETQHGHCSYSDYVIFLSDLMAMLLDKIFPSTPFTCRTTALSIIALIVDIFKPEALDNNKTGSMFPLSTVTESRQLTLLQCLTDTFEENKTTAFKIFIALPKPFFLKNISYQKELLSIAMTLCTSTKPQDCSTAAYLLHLLLCQESIGPVLDDYQLQLLTTMSAEMDQLEQVIFNNKFKTKNYLRIVWLLIVLLKDQIQVAHDSLVHAAASRPLYPTIHCIRYILTSLDQSQMEDATECWRNIFDIIVNVCLEVSTIVSPVVHNSSPEGNIPEDAIMGPGLNVGALVGCQGDQEALQNAISQSNELVTLMPEYLVVCCWRSIKEVSLLLGQICQDISVGDGDVNLNDKPDLITVNQVISIGDYFTTQLLESKHRGAFELAYAGFVKMCDMLWRSSIPSVHTLPCQWLDNIMDAISCQNSSSKFCATRRSAGIPFYIQAIVSTEPISTGNVNFKQTMVKLLDLATDESTTDSKSTESKVHALNILRSLYRDTRLGESVAPYVADGLKAAILGFSSHLWAITNSATLLLSSLMTRIFGVNRTKLDKNLPRKNCQTGRTFFTHYPSLYQFLLEQIDKASPQLQEEKSSVSINPTLYPVLLVLGRLYPSTLDGIHMGLNLNAFIPYIIRCSASPIMKTREMAARALKPLVSKDQLALTINKLLSHIPPEKTSEISQNFLHGLLLQIQQLVLLLPTLLQCHQESAIQDVMETFHKRLWILSEPSICLIIRQVALDITMSFVSDDFSCQKSSSSQSLLVSALMDLCDIEYEKLSFLSPLWFPGQAQYLVTVCKIQLWKLKQTQRQCEDFPALRQILIDYLNSSLYEIRLEVLHWIKTECAFRNQLENNSESFQHLLDFVCQSTELVDSLLAFIYSEDHPQCLAEVLRLFTCPPIASHIAQMDILKASKLSYHIVDLLEQYQGQEIQECAVTFSAELFPRVYYELSEETSLLERWCAVLTLCSATEQSASLQLACTRFLHKNAILLLKDPDKVLGKLKYTFWGILVNLLQEDDMQVKESAVIVLNRLNPSNIVSEHPALTIPSLLEHLLLQQDNSSDVSPILTAISWIRNITQSNNDTEDRLFDRGEMNTYRDEMNFVQTVASYLDCVINDSFISNCQLLPDETPLKNTSCYSQPLPNLPCIKPEDIKESSVERIKEEFSLTSRLLISRLSQMKSQTTMGSLFDIISHQTDCLDTYKLLLSLFYLQKMLLPKDYQQFFQECDTISKQINIIFGSSVNIRDTLQCKCYTLASQISQYYTKT
ncbi:thyroid adenoma-associated protein homolog [Octopus sinensis]|uniref:tRNA (32-2'-O)-methyltransferase regulator THADA n=1 Tax=Octopus sinensis TaxID=2607531 RepID=A0A6P7U9J9_9MOLL|nr:thyroid adenoma-associated protein homolog [Octopus sinensis]